MRAEPVSGIQPELLRWARQTIGLSVPEVAELMKRAPADIEAWETGSDAPSYPQLEKLAYQIYKRPLAVFFLPAPPAEPVPKREFRTLPDSDLQHLSRDTYLHIRHAHAYQLALEELFDGRNPFERHIWESVQLNPSGSIETQARRLRSYLGVSLEEQSSWRDDELALKNWRKSIEESGIFVFKAAFKQKDISGFCLVSQQFPIVYLNNSTTKTRQIFSLFHELAHLLVNVSGLSKFDTSYIERLPQAQKKLERFCNAVAAEALIPSSDFAKQIASFPYDAERATEEQFSALASRYGVSREAVLRRFLDMGRVGQPFYDQKAAFWASQQKEGSGGNWYSNQGTYLSERFSKEVVVRHHRQQITLEQAADFLGMKPKTFVGFQEHVLKGLGA